MNTKLDIDIDIPTTTRVSSGKPRAPKTSPRTNSFNQVISLIDTYLNGANPAAADVLTLLRADVQGLIGTPLNPKSSKSDEENDTEESESSSTTGVHFVGVKEDGEVAYLNAPKGKLTTTGYKEVYGSFRTEAGALYAITHSTFSQRPQVL